MTENADQRLLKLLIDMDENEASDLFLSEDKVPAFRIHGVLHEANTEATRREEILALMERVLVGANRASFENRGDWDAGLSLGESRYRLNLSRQKGMLNV